MWKLRTISDEELTKLVEECTSYRQIALKLKMTGGSTQGVLKQRITALGIDVSHFPGKGWCRGLTKELHPGLASSGQKTRLRLKGHPGHRHSFESRQKISKSASERSFHNGLIKTKWFKVYNPTTQSDVSVQGTWELKYATWLNENHVKWIRPKISFKWKRNDEDIEHTYHPDFHLCDDDVYVEIKGFMWKDIRRGVDDALKMQLVIQQNPCIKFRLLMKEDLKMLGML